MKQMIKGGWDSSHPPDQQWKWLEKEKRNKTKKIGVLLIHQLVGLIDQEVASTKWWSEDKEKIRELESRVRELEKQNQVLEEKQWRGETVPLPPYESIQQGLTAPSGE